MTTPPPPALRLLEVSITGEQIAYAVTVDGSRATVTGPRVTELRAFEERARAARQAPSSPEAEQRFLRSFMDTACVPDLESALRFVKPQTCPFLFVRVIDFGLAGLPWEALPAMLEMQDTMAVRVVHADPEPEQPVTRSGETTREASPAPERLLLVSSSRSAAKTSASSAAEAGEVARAAMTAGMEVTTMLEPNPEDAVQKLATLRPQRLHISTPSVERAAGGVRIQVSGVGAEAKWLEASALGDAVSKIPLDSALVSASNGALPVCGALCAAGARAAVGWAGWAEDEQMRRFSAFFYQRISEGHSPAAAVQLYFTSVLRRNASLLTGTPMVWLRAPDLSAGKITPKRRKKGFEGYTGADRDGRNLGVEPAPPASYSGTQVEVHTRSALNPALLKNGCPAVEHLLVTTDTNRLGARLSITCDTGFCTSTYVRQIDLLAGPQQVMTRDARFPCLDELVLRSRDRRRVNFVVTLRDRDEGRVFAEATQSVLCMGGREWLGQPDSWAYLPAFVLPYDAAVQRVVSDARPMLRTFECPHDDFMAYYAGDPANVDVQAKAIFKTLQITYGIRYMPPPGLAVFDPEERRVTGQFVRLPGDILEHKWGTCHDLSLLYSACLETIGIRPIVVMKAGHTFAGYWRDRNAHIAYWRARRDRAPAGEPFGSGWMIEDSADLDQLLQSKAITLVETTDVTRQDRSYDSAASAWIDRSDPTSLRFVATDFQVAVDIRASRAMVQPL